MSIIQAQATDVIAASPGRVFEIISDYRDGHPGILPDPPFKDYEVESGGHGLGTIIRFKMKSLGSLREFRVEVSEVAPGRKLVETDLISGARTMYMIGSAGGGKSRVSITTRWESSGIRGLVERIFARSMLESVYRDILANLDKAVRTAPTTRREDS